MRRFAAGILVASFWLSSCGASDPVRGAGTPTPRDSATTKPTIRPSGVPGETEAQRVEREKKALGYSPQRPPPDGFVQSNPDNPRPGALTLSVRFRPSCIELGGLVKLTAKTSRPRVRVSFISTLADGNNRAVESDGRTDDKGLWEWTFVVRPDAEPRTYEMLGAALDDGKKPAGEDDQVLGNWFYVVARPGECPS